MKYTELQRVYRLARRTFNELEEKIKPELVSRRQGFQNLVPGDTEKYTQLMNAFEVLLASHNYRQILEQMQKAEDALLARFDKIMQAQNLNLPIVLDKGKRIQLALDWKPPKNPAWWE